MQFSSFAEILDAGFLRFVTLAFLLLGIIFGLMQPAGSSSLTRPEAVLFWLLHAVCAIPCVILAVWLLARTKVMLPPWLFVGVSGLLAAIVLAFAALSIEKLFAVEDFSVALLAQPKANGYFGVWLDEFTGLAPPFVLAWMLINLPRLQRIRAIAPAMTEPQAAGLLAGLPAELGNDVVLLSSDLHYLHVHTTRGKAMLLYNLADAETELDGRGMRVHRSHWVADQHVLGLLRKGSSVICQLRGGLSVPVSRRRQAEAVARYGRNTRYFRAEA
jgi:hypothetical protein